MQVQRKALYTIRISTDLILLVFGFVIAYYTGSRRANKFGAIELVFLIALLMGWLYFSRIIHLYDEFRSRNFSFEFINVLKGVVFQIFCSIIYIFFVPEISPRRMFITRYSITILFLIILEKYFIRKMLEGFRKRGRNLRTVLIIGAGKVGQKFYEAINDNPHFGYRLVGFLDDSPNPSLNGSYLGPISSLEKIIYSKSINDVIVALPNKAVEKIETVIAVCEKHTIRVKIIPEYFKFLSSKYNISMFGKFPIISVRDEPLNELHWILLKRLFDIFISGLLFLTVFIWLWPIIAVLIKLTSKGPVFFKQERWGRNNKAFYAYKFRTMSSESRDVDENGKYQQAVKNDPRITKFGKLLRKTNLDELPQFINVLLGEMSIVGPRPHPIPLNIESKNSIKNYMLRHLVKPGITGWAQVNGYRGETKEPGTMEKRVEYDLWYIENWSFWLDLQIIILTTWRMIKGDPNAY